MDEIDTTIKDTLLHTKPVGILLALADSPEKYASIVAKEVDCTYPHTLKILSIYEKHGLVEFEKEGRIKRVKLTGKGEEIAHDLAGLTRRLENINQEEDETETQEGEEQDE